MFKIPGAQILPKNAFECHTSQKCRFFAMSMLFVIVLAHSVVKNFPIDLPTLL